MSDPFLTEVERLTVASENTAKRLRAEADDIAAEYFETIADENCIFPTAAVFHARAAKVLRSHAKELRRSADGWEADLAKIDLVGLTDAEREALDS